MLRFTAHSMTRTSERIFFAGRFFDLDMARYALRRTLRYVRGRRGSSTVACSLSIMPSGFSLASFSSEKSCGWRMFDGEHVASRIIVPRFPFTAGLSSLSSACSGSAWRS